MDLLGNEFVNAKGEKFDASALKGKNVGIYFSAHWCPPCRGFTPELVKTYNKITGDGKPFEIVFASSDRDEAAFNEYLGEMPWLAIPYANRDLKEALSKKFKVSGIPTFVMLDADGKTISTKARGKVSEDPEGASFPWTPKTFHEAIGSEFVTPGGDTVLAKDKLAGKTVGIYFSAHWCPPCRGFTPELVKTYNKVTGDGKPFEIVFVSGDRDEAAFKEYHGEQPWLAVPFGDKARNNELNSMFDVEGIPSFVVVDFDSGKTINGEGRSAVGGDPEGAEFPWHPKPCNDISNPDGINEETCVIAMVEGCDDGEQDEYVAVMEKVAAEHKEKADRAGGDMDFKFFFSKNGGGVAEQIRKLTGMGNPKPDPSLLILDIPDGGGFYVKEFQDLTADSVNGMIGDYKAKSLERKQLKRG